MPGGNNIEDLLAQLGGKKDKNNSFDTSNAGNGLFSGGKDFGAASGSSALSGIKDMAMGLIQNLLGGLFGGGGGGIMGMVSKVAGMLGGL